ncbi:MAG TPA: protein kinase [Pyrinomonadaceae bacterium]|nr:protein kinase [Pyrinomonadaceae bacterium]
MTTRDSWQRIKEILDCAYAMNPAERSDFLDEICGDDQWLRDEVEALLLADASNEDFIEKRAIDFVRDIPAEPSETAEFLEGQKVGRYTIQRLLGVGGMGQIYLAQDELLGRLVALKFIAREFATDPRRVQRFEQEARAVSALNHPNVCIIHEIGVAENRRHFIAMEYIEGSTLRDKLQSGSLTPRDAVNIAIQIAAGLASAHAAGIVHRDIKPENIMLPPHGFAKVLDFGLAKLTERVPQGAPGLSGTVHTEAGLLMGTVKYMSPEQLRQTVLDERTDIWSLGIVLYEMVTGTTPFEAGNSADSMAQIVGPQTPPLTFPSGLPPGLPGIIRKAIEKDRAARYQSVKQLRADLIELQRGGEHQPGNGVPTVPPPPFQWPTNGYSTQATAGSAIFRRLTSRALSTAVFLISEIKQHKLAFRSATAVLILLLGIPGAARIIDRLLNPEASSPPSFSIQSFTNTNSALLAALSPDGRLVAHVEDVFGKQRVMISPRDIPGSPTELISPESINYLGVTFSRDGNHLYVTRKVKQDPGILYRVPLGGGTLVHIREGVESPITFSPQGEQYAFVRYDEPKKEYSLIVADSEGTNERILATRKRPATLSTYGVSWSPDGATIVCPAGRWDNGFHMDLVGLNVKTGEERKISPTQWFSVYQVDWQDMNNLIICARERDTAPHQLWRITFPDGMSHQITNDSNEYKGVSVAGTNIVTVQTNRTWLISVATPGTLTPAAPIASGSGLSYGVSWSADGTIVHSAMAQKRLNIWRVDPETLNQVKLTTEGDNYNPVVSPDGRFIVFSSNRNDGKTNIWRMNAKDGSGLQQLTFTDGNYYPAISPDNQWVAYDNLVDSKTSVWKVPLFGGAAVKVAEGYRMPVFSPDSRRIAVRYHLTSGTRDVAIFPVEGGEAVQRLPIPILEWQRMQWLDDRRFSYIDTVNGVSNLWSYDIHTGVPKQLTFFDSDQIVTYSWSPDFKQVACQRVTNTSEVTIHSSER